MEPFAGPHVVTPHLSKARQMVIAVLTRELTDSDATRLDAQHVGGGEEPGRSVKPGR